MKKKSVFLTGLSSLFLAMAFVASYAVAEEMGQCNFTLRNDFAGPFKACQIPATPSECEVIGDTDRNSDAQFSTGECAIDSSVVGVCDIEGVQLYFYSGDASSLEVQCGFQSGEWTE